MSVDVTQDDPSGPYSIALSLGSDSPKRLAHPRPPLPDVSLLADDYRYFSRRGGDGTIIYFRKGEPVVAFRRRWGKVTLFDNASTEPWGVRPGATFPTSAYVGPHCTGTYYCGVYWEPLDSLHRGLWDSVYPNAGT